MGPGSAVHREERCTASGTRVAHLIVYTIGLPVFRTLTFTVGFLAQAVLVLAIFRIV